MFDAVRRHGDKWRFDNEGFVTRTYVQTTTHNYHPALLIHDRKGKELVENKKFAGFEDSSGL